ncbi:MAG: hypothetical protein ACO3EE_06315 [Flavobacteriales bacterium]
MKTTKYDIKIDSKPISEKDIEKHMNFDKTYEAYTHWTYRHPWYRFQRHANKNRKILLWIILIAVIAALVIMESF